MNSVAVIGGGPAGLMAAEEISQHYPVGSVSIDLYEAKPSVGRKFLVAGKGGLNLTHAESFDDFVNRFGPAAQTLRPLLQKFGPQQVRDWCHALGIETFVGGSKRIFPKGTKAFPLLQRWLERLKTAGVNFHTQHAWRGWNDNGQLVFQTNAGMQAKSHCAVVLALGGASWSNLGSDGKWQSILEQRHIQLAPMRPANSGFDVQWSDHFRERFAGEPLKSVVLSFTNSIGQSFRRQGSCVVTRTGLEGSLIYAASRLLRDEISISGSATILLDLSPDNSVEKLTQRLSIPRASKTVSSHLRSKVKIKGVQFGLLREIVPDKMHDPVALAQAIKSLPVRLIAARPLDEAISTAGGVCFSALNSDLMLNSAPGIFCAGEMLDWEAPTGGYLLTACLATGKAAGQGVVKWLTANGPSD